MIAGEQQVALLQCERHVVRGVAGRGDRLDGPASAGDHLAVGQRAVGLELGIVAGVEARRLADIERSRGAMRPFGEHHGPGRRLDSRHRGGMIPMRMRHEDMGDGFPAYRIEQGRNVRLVERTGIDDRNVALADDVGQGPLERERARIVGEHPAHPGRDLIDDVGRKVEALIEGNVVAHAHQPWEKEGLLPMLSRTSGSRAEVSSQWVSRACAR